MPDLEAFRARAETALLHGEAEPDSPPVDGGARWGLSVILRPDPVAAGDLARLGEQATTFAGAGHWVHSARNLHFTLWTLEAHSTREMRGDPLVAKYSQALEELSDFTAIDLEIAHLIPHPKGVMTIGYCDPATLPVLRERYIAALEARGVSHYEPVTDRDMWHCNILHFAAAVRDPAGLVAWAEAERATLATTRLTRAELVRWRMDGDVIAPEVLHHIELCS